MRNIIFIFSALFIVFIVGCSENVTQGNNVIVEEEKEMMDDDVTDVKSTEDDTEEEVKVVETETESDWKDFTLKDVRTGSEFKVSDFEGTPVLLESFAVWCPKCKKQQDEIKKLHEEVGDDVVSIALDTDPNEDEQKVLEHINRHGYDWLYAVSPSELTQQLIDEFGIGFVNAPSVPVILICEDQSTRYLDRGNKDKDELLSGIGKGC